VSGLAEYLGIRDGENVVYAEDSNLWQSGKNVDEEIMKLTEKAALFVDYTRSMGLNECIKDPDGPLGQRGDSGQHQHDGGQELYHPKQHHRAPGHQV
jgi:hypothetical protein